MSWVALCETGWAKGSSGHSGSDLSPMLLSSLLCSALPGRSDCVIIVIKQRKRANLSLAPADYCSLSCPDIALGEIGEAAKGLQSPCKQCPGS